jgi:hypothetical protein
MVDGREGIGGPGQFWLRVTQHLLRGDAGGGGADAADTLGARTGRDVIRDLLCATGIVQPSQLPFHSFNHRLVWVGPGFHRIQLTF